MPLPGDANLIQDRKAEYPHIRTRPSGRNGPSRAGVVAVMIKREAVRETGLPLRLIAPARAPAKPDKEAAPPPQLQSAKVRSIADRLERAKKPGLY
jgi:hypothetical protein